VRVLNVELNGRTPDLAQTQRLATLNYGHYTSMQVRGGKVRGLALHIARLDDGNETFFGGRMDIGDEHRLREFLRHALAGAADASARVALVAGPSPEAPPDVLVTVSDPAPDDPGPPLRVRLDRFERNWPEQKHAATMGQLYAIRRAKRAGYDDALLVGPGGQVREGSAWNVAFWDGEKVVWPQAPALKGVTMVLLQIAMTMTGTPWALRPVGAGEIPDLLAAAAVSSRRAAHAIASIDDVQFGENKRLVDVLTDAWATVPYDEI
jgi:branched-subunit amino acid aminotransferase/4-amino-4-deoxychorismate lyase